MESIRSAMEKRLSTSGSTRTQAIGTDAAATAVREEGLRFRVEGPKGDVTSDMSESVGGGARRPRPAGCCEPPSPHVMPRSWRWRLPARTSSSPT